MAMLKSQRKELRSKVWKTQVYTKSTHCTFINSRWLNEQARVPRSKQQNVKTVQCHMGVGKWGEGGNWSGQDSGLLLLQVLVQPQTLVHADSKYEY